MVRRGGHPRTKLGTDARAGAFPALDIRCMMLHSLSIAGVCALLGAAALFGRFHMMTGQAAMGAMMSGDSTAERVTRDDEASRVLSPIVRDEVLYHFMPLTWRVGPGQTSDFKGQAVRFGTFRGMTEGLPYLASLGVTGVWINPIFPSPAYHGYQHDDATKLNPRLGTEEEFVEFVKAARALNIKVYLDIVVYGISTGSEMFTMASADAKSEFRPWLAFRDEKELAAAKSRNDTSPFQGYTFTTWTGERMGIIWFDLRRREPRELAARWAAKWLDPNQDGDLSDGVAGFRLDHVWEKYPWGPDGWGYNLHPFWSEWKAALQKVNPNVATFAEQARWETTGAGLLGPFDAAFTKPLQFAVRDGFRDADAAKITKTLERTLDELNPGTGASEAWANRSAAGHTFFAVIGDHDVDRLSSSLGGDVTNVDENMARSKAAAVVLLTQPFPPVIYAGDEIGMLGKEGKFGSDANDIPRREPFKWGAVDAEPMTDYWKLEPRTIERRYSKDNDGRSVQEQAGVTGSLLEVYREVIKVRRGHEVLHSGTYATVKASSPKVLAFARHIGDTAAVVVVNLGAEKAENVALDLSGLAIAGESPVNVVMASAGARVPGVVGAAANKGDEKWTVTLEPFGYAVCTTRAAGLKRTPRRMPARKAARLRGRRAMNEAAMNAAMLAAG
jgi:alpha-amylase